jgi:hypothetical protein
MALKLEKLPNNVYLLTLTGDGEHRFTPRCISEIVAALDEVLLFLFKLLFPSVFKTQSLSTSV